MTSQTNAVRLALIDLRRLAVKYPWKGQQDIHQRHRLITNSLLEPDRPICVIYTYDVGYHSSGWWRNSEYERCFHLSLSHQKLDPAGWQVGIEAPTESEIHEWAKLAWPTDWKKAWLEPPASVLSIDVLEQRRYPGVGHVRLFLDLSLTPILPTGEVYNLKPFADGASPEKVFR